MKMIPASTMAEAWLQACQHLVALSQWTDTTVVLLIEQPTLVRVNDQAVSSELDRFLSAHGQFSNHTVAETIFPGYEYVRHGVDGVYRVYPEEIYPQIEHHPDMRHWGSYAYRLLRRRGADGTMYNPLEYCVEKMKDVRPKRAAYEVGLGFGFDLATYDDDTDRPDRMGGPCLSHLSFKFIGGKIHLTALYRSHYYVHRAFGNLLGLARLQSFVADQVGAEVGPLVCHSTMAVVEHGNPFAWNKAAVRDLLAECDRHLRHVDETSAVC
jgi:hypothetical protein